MAWPMTICDVKIMVIALATPAKNRIRVKAATELKAAMASSNAPVENKPQRATSRSRPEPHE
ncbi:hypothetical protein D3C80_1925550 [compost metagenome]